MTYSYPRHRWCLVVLSLLTQTWPAEHVAAQTSQAFSLRLVQTPPSAAELAPLPVLAVVPTGSVPISHALAAQLTQALTAARRERSGGDLFGVLTRERPGMSKIGWAFAARTDARSRYAELGARFAEQLRTCLHALPETSLELAALLTLLGGAPLTDPYERAAAIAAGDAMLEAWRSNRCSAQPNTAALIEQRREQSLAAAHGMLTGEFDATKFRGQALLDLIDALTPLWFHADGLWASERSPHLRALFTRALESGFLNTASFDATRPLTFNTFFDWAIYQRDLQPTATRALYRTVAQSCIADLSAASGPFSVERCLADGRLETVTLHFDTLERLALQPPEAP